MFIAQFKTTKGPATLPISRDMVLEGMVQNGFSGPQTVQAMNNISRGVPVIIGNCTVAREKGNRKCN